ncbi:MAG: serine hydrolase [Deinococcota bacterium]|nr:serine hydrolase [Deinococcota bacterium]
MAYAQNEVTPQQVQTAVSSLDKLAAQAVGEGQVPGLAIAVVHNDQVVYLKGFGVREVGMPEAVDADTVFQLASMSKPIASTVVAAIVSSGAASWDDPVIVHDPEFRLKDSWVTGQVTIRDFFAHRSGLPGNAGEDLEGVGYERDEILRRLRYVEPASSLRSSYAYSNIGMTEGAIAAAKAVGKSWEAAAAELLYRPLGMSSTSSRFVDYAAATNRALPHVKEGNGWAARFTRQPDAQSPSAGVSSSVRDLTQWMRLQLGEGMLGTRQVIGAAALADTHRPQIAKGANWVTEAPTFYGLGWDVEYDQGGLEFWSHAGAFDRGARTFVSLLPPEGLGIVVLSNAFPTGVPEGLVASFYDLALNGKLSRDWVSLWNTAYQTRWDSVTAGGNVYARPPAQPSPAMPLSAYVGTYSNDYVGELEVAIGDGGLILRMGPQKKIFILRHFDRDTFTYAQERESLAPLEGLTFTIGPDRQAQRVALEDLTGDGRWTFTRVSPPR